MTPRSLSTAAAEYVLFCTMSASTSSALGTSFLRTVAVYTVFSRQVLTLKWPPRLSKSASNCASERLAVP